MQTTICYNLKLYNSNLGIKIVKFNKKKHKRDPWITYGILKSVNQKNILFKRIKKTNVESPLYNDRKRQFSSYKIILRRLMNQAKTLYYGTEFNRHVVMGNKLGTPLTMPCTEK